MTCEHPMKKRFKADAYELDGRILSLSAICDQGDARIGEVHIPEESKVPSWVGGGHGCAVVEYDFKSKGFVFHEFMEGCGISYPDFRAIVMEANILNGDSLGDPAKFIFEAMRNGGADLVKLAAQFRPADVDLDAALTRFLNDVGYFGQDNTIHFVSGLIDAGAKITDKARESARASSYPALYTLVCGHDADMSKLESAIIRCIDMMWQPKRYSSQDIIERIDHYLAEGHKVTDYVLAQATFVDRKRGDGVNDYWDDVMPYLRSLNADAAGCSHEPLFR